jgi:putative alpha-1,2-mannosidase
MTGKLILVTFVCFFVSICNVNAAEKLVYYVNPFIGTDEDGHTFPGALVPFGMVQLSPDNGEHGYNWCSGYHYSSNKIQGFSHTHYSGTGAESLCDISVFPLVNANPTWESVSSEFSHQQEMALYGYCAKEGMRNFTFISIPHGTLPILSGSMEIR